MGELNDEITKRSKNFITIKEKIGLLGGVCRDDEGFSLLPRAFRMIVSDLEESNRRLDIIEKRISSPGYCKKITNEIVKSLD